MKGLTVRLYDDNSAFHPPKKSAAIFLSDYPLGKGK